MNQFSEKHYSPVVSVCTIVLVLLGLVFVKMEVVRMGYEVLRNGKLVAKERDVQRRLATQYSHLMRPERLDQIGTERLQLGRAEKTQVVLMSENRFENQL